MYDLAGSLDDVTSDTATARGVRSPEDSDRGRDLERHARNPARRAYVLGGKASERAIAGFLLS